MQVLRISALLLTLIFLNSVSSFGQPKLKILFTRFGMLKKYELSEDDILQYKLKGQHKYRIDRIVALHDSTVILAKDSLILNELKSIRIKSDNYHAKLFQKIFLVGGIGFPALNIFNSALNHVSPLLTEKALIITGSFLAASFIINQLRIKRIRLTKNKSIRIVDIDFENLNRK